MAESEPIMEKSNKANIHLVRGEATQVTPLPVELPQHGPKVSELGYEAGGHGKLVERAMLGEKGQVELTRDDLHDPKKISLIHPLWRDELDKGNKLVLHSWGNMDIIHPKTKEVVVFDGKK